MRYVNPAMQRTVRSVEQHLAVSSDDLVGTTIDTLHRDPALRAIVQRPSQLPHTAQIAIGDETVELTISSIHDSTGTYIGAMTTWSVVTETLRLAGEARAAQERERAAAAELQDRVDSLLVTLAAAASGDLTDGGDGVGRRRRRTDGRRAHDVARRTCATSVSSIARNSQALAGAAEELQVVSTQMGSNSAETSNQVEPADRCLDRGAPGTSRPCRPARSR